MMKIVNSASETDTMMRTARCSFPASDIPTSTNEVRAKNQEITYAQTRL
jgi:hypothetical protein